MKSKNKNIITGKYRYKKYRKSDKSYIGKEEDFYKTKEENYYENDLVGNSYYFEKHNYFPYFLFKLYWNFVIWKSKPINRKFKTIYKLSLFQRITVFGMIISSSWALYIYSNKDELNHRIEKQDVEILSLNDTVFYLKTQLDSVSKEFLELKIKNQKSKTIKELKE